MKQLVCEMCGSADLMKQDGVFVCQSCGCKYSVEEARKMMSEGDTDVVASGVQAKPSSELANLYQIARRAKDADNDENAAKYYDMILVKDPTSWEATFFVVYFQAKQCKIANIASASTSVNNCIQTTMQLIKDYVDGEDAQMSAYSEVAAAAIGIQKLFYNAAKNHYQGIDFQIRDRYKGEFDIRAANAIQGLITVGDCLDEIFNDQTGARAMALVAWKTAINLNIDYSGKSTTLEGYSPFIKTTTAKVQKYEPEFMPPLADPNAKSGGCYVATAVYGSYDCPQVWTLRRFRDYTLAETWYGRAFIRTYYAVSPTLVKWFGHTEWFKKMWKGKLDRMVANLNAEGVEDTPYEDKNW